jgi:hypothetical protein
MRTCPDCQRELDESEFYKNKRTGYYYSYCKKCCSKRAIKLKNREELAPPNKRGHKRIFDYDLITELILEGFSDQNIAAEIGCSRGTVSRIRLYAGIVIKDLMSTMHDKRFGRRVRLTESGRELVGVME